MRVVTQPWVELYKSIAERLWEEALSIGGITGTKEWRQLRSSASQAKWRGGITLHYDGGGCSAAAGGTAPEIYAALLRGLAGSREAEYGWLTFFGDPRCSPSGRAMLLAL